MDAPDDMIDELRTAQTLLDLGCGRGNLLGRLRRIGWTGSYCGVDISERAISDAKILYENDLHSFFLIGDLDGNRRLECSARSWHAIVLVESIYYLSPHKAMTLVHSLLDRLRPGGKLIIRVHDPVKHELHITALLRLGNVVRRVSPQVFVIANRFELSN